MSKRILWARKVGEYTSYYFANFKLSDLDGSRPGGGWTDEELEKKYYGKDGFALYKLVREIEGVASFDLSANQLTVHRLAGWKPVEVFPKVVRAIKQVYGDDVAFECHSQLKDVITLIKGKVS